MSALLEAVPRASSTSHVEVTEPFDLHVRGEIPSCLDGYLVIATSRRHKTRSFFSRWHDSQADLLRIELTSGRPGSARATFLSVDRNWGYASAGSGSLIYVAQPNHGLNSTRSALWATNLLFGAPLEIDVESWRPRKALVSVHPTSTDQHLSSTSHFAWSLDRRYAYFHQSLLVQCDAGVSACDLTLVELDTQNGRQRLWKMLPPADDQNLESANFHSAFYYEEFGRRYVGLLRTGARLEKLKPHDVPQEHDVKPMEVSTIWILELRDDRDELQATMLPGVRELGGFALSHLDVDATSRDGFVLFANCKQAAVAEETHGENLYGEQAGRVPEHYSGMIIEPFNYGQVIRYSRRAGTNAITTFARPYVPGRTSIGHSWLPINVHLDSSRQRLFCSFAGFHPRLLPRHVANAYRGLVADLSEIQFIPPLLMRFDAATLEPDIDPKRRHLSYSESIAFCVVGGDKTEYICTFAPDVGLRIYQADDLTRAARSTPQPWLRARTRDRLASRSVAHQSEAHRSRRARRR